MIEVRCHKCNRLLFKVKEVAGIYIECKCNKCGEINRIKIRSSDANEVQGF